MLIILLLIFYCLGSSMKILSFAKYGCTIFFIISPLYGKKKENKYQNLYSVLKVYFTFHRTLHLMYNMVINTGMVMNYEEFRRIPPYQSYWIVSEISQPCIPEINGCNGFQVTDSLKKRNDLQWPPPPPFQFMNWPSHGTMGSGRLTI